MSQFRSVATLTLLITTSQAASGSEAVLNLEIRAAGTNAALRWNSASGETFQVEHRTALSASNWLALVTNWPASPSNSTTFLHTSALNVVAGFYRVLRHPLYTFDWTGTNFTYTDAQRSFSGILLKPDGVGPFPAVVINHGAGGTATGYSLAKAREMMPWGMVCIGPTLTHVLGGETNAVNMGFCPENLARAAACLTVLRGLSFVDTNHMAIFGHSMGAFATIGDVAVLGGQLQAAAITAGGVIPDNAPGGTTNASPTVTEASPVTVPFLMIHCDGDPVVPASRSLAFQQILNSNAVPNLRILISSNSIPNSNNWHNIQNDSNANAVILTNTRSWFQTHGVLEE